jgi:hypothetical protein
MHIQATFHCDMLKGLKAGVPVLPKTYMAYVTIMCCNDELSSTMSWVGCLLKDSEIFILFAENSQILLKISVIPILITFMYLVALNLLVNNQLNSSSNSTHAADNWIDSSELSNTQFIKRRKMDQNCSFFYI